MCGPESLLPGQHVEIADGVAVGTYPGRAYGIVDPFLTKTVLPGEHFWFVIYPRQITSLRHVWEHPAFPAAKAEIVAERQFTPEELAIAEKTKNHILRSESEQWLRRCGRPELWLCGRRRPELRL